MLLYNEAYSTWEKLKVFGFQAMISLKDKKL